jgi:hypothetical protein
MKSAHPELTVFLILFLCMFTGCEDQNVTSIEITNPEKGEVYNSGEYVTIKWEATGSVYETYCVVNGELSVGPPEVRVHTNGGRVVIWLEE